MSQCPTVVYPYVCPFPPCTKAYSQPTQLIRHLRQCHANRGISDNLALSLNAVRCSHCFDYFSTNGIVSHTQRIHRCTFTTVITSTVTSSSSASTTTTPISAALANAFASPFAPITSRIPLYNEHLSPYNAQCQLILSFVQLEQATQRHVILIPQHLLVSLDNHHRMPNPNEKRESVNYLVIFSVIIIVIVWTHRQILIT